MNRLKEALVPLALVTLVALPAAAGTTTYTDTFEGGTNAGSWTWGFGDTIEPTGGNPNSYLRTEGLDTYAPRPTATTGPFVGDYRAMKVTSVGVDLNTFYVDFSAAERNLTLVLLHNNDTPDDPFDDTAAYYLGPFVPEPGDGWKSFNISVPSQQTSLPAGWLLLNMGDSGSPATHDWNQVIQHVSEIYFHYGDPTFFYIFQQWILGMDNARITTDTGGGGEPDHKVTICHRPPGNPNNARTIRVGASALPAHLAHGDTVGACGSRTPSNDPPSRRVTPRQQDQIDTEVFGRR